MYWQFTSSSATTPLKPSSITSFFAAKPSTSAKKRKPQVIEIDADKGPDQAVIVSDNAATEKDSRLVDVVFVLDVEGLLVSFHAVTSPDDVTYRMDLMSHRVAYRCAQNSLRLQL